MSGVKKELKWLIKPTLDTKPAEEIDVRTRRNGLVITHTDMNIRNI